MVADAVLDGSDCDDRDPDVNPGAAETCAAGDQNCDGLIDADDPNATLDPWYADDDGDGYGDPGTIVPACEAAPGTVADDQDCDDADPNQPSEWRSDSDGDGFAGAPSGFGCAPPSPGDLPATAALDCDDADGATHPGASEVCTDGLDQDCDALVDCEDAGCEGSACGELVCDDGLDTDGDGLVDCDDDDCWGLGCHEDGVRARVLGGRFTMARDWNRITYFSYGQTGDTYQWSFKTGTASSVTGSVVVVPPGQRFSTATAFTTCAFSVGQAQLRSSYFRSVHGFDDVYVQIDRTPPVRTGVTIAPGCRLAGTSWMPQQLWLSSGAALDPALGVKWYPGGGGTSLCRRRRSAAGRPPEHRERLVDHRPHAGWRRVADGPARRHGRADRAALTISGETAGWGDAQHPGDAVGAILALVGDQDGDGLDDVAIGMTDLLSGHPEGSVAVVSGAAVGSVGVSGAFATLTGTTLNDQAGQVSAVGDVNGDGFDDLVVGAKYHATLGAFTYDGAAYVVYGPVSGTIGLATADVRLNGAVSWDSAGSRIGAAGDVNGDGHDDFLVGAEGVQAGGYDRGAAYLILESTARWLHGHQLATAAIVGAVNYDQLGRWALGPAGDVDGDGLGDFFVGAPNEDGPGGFDVGAVGVFLGR